MTQNFEVKKVLLIFKTHLDIGYTDYAENVTDKYLDTFIPNAIRVGYELKETDTPFVWTVGSWLVNEALKNGTPMLEEAINDGIISWHGLPCTTHTELMSPALFEYGLGISQKLDKRFGKTTFAAKMTDVPGHTVGMVPYLAKAGIRFLHIGVNPATPLPKVPRLFKWKSGDDSIAVMYQTDYGTTDIIGNTAIMFAHTGDNNGPQDAEVIKSVYREAAERYPNAVIAAGTINDIAEAVDAYSGDIPVIDREIGDSWIHGAGTDPKKVSMYRTLLRYIDEYGIGDADLSDNLMLVPEHTWGLALESSFHDTENFTYDELVPIAEKRAVMEKSWEEQRDYIYAAQKVLGVTADYDTSVPDTTGFAKLDDEKCDIEISWQLFDRRDYHRYEEVYMRAFKEWCMWDFTRFGLPKYDGGVYTAEVKEVYVKDDRRIYILRFDAETEKKYGLPFFTIETEGKNVSVKWFGKKMSRLPMAFWLKFRGFEEKWEINKLGKWIDPEEIIDASLISAVYEGVKNDTVLIKPLDSALVAPFGRNLLNYNIEDKKQDMYFNLYNNIWNTNFPFWYDDDALFRFEIQEIK